MTALGILYPGHFAEDDYPRIEQLLGGDIRVDLVHTDPGEDGTPQQLTAGVDELRLAGTETVVWASVTGSSGYGWDGAHDQVRSLARLAGTPASSTSLAFVNALREIEAGRVSVGVTCPPEEATLFTDFLRAGGVTVTGLRSAGPVSAAEAAGWGEEQVLALARAADEPDAQAVVLPDTALHTAAFVPLLEKAVGKPVLTASQVTVWEALRLTDRRVNAPELGALFTRQPIVQV
ncbi:decarboxylase [Streptomyces sp. NPDC086787]|uniref:maleate cis-trans isomerase family protein n=1 Tax=Streptomyces sp. NPDC086787 TaxID=3365759 RepID=UPI003805F8BF